MKLDELSLRLDAFYANPPANLLIQIPAGTGICHIANVPPHCWESGFVGVKEGRWKPPGELKKHYGNILPTCANELFGGNPPSPESITCELWEAERDFMALNISAFPKDLQTAFYEDFGPAPKKWEKPNLAITKFYSYDISTNVGSIYAPSASGILLGEGGTVLVANPRKSPIRFIETGSYASYMGAF